MIALLLPLRERSLTEDDHLRLIINERTSQILIELAITRLAAAVFRVIHAIPTTTIIRPLLLRITLTGLLLPDPPYPLHRQRFDLAIPPAAQVLPILTISGGQASCTLILNLPPLVPVILVRLLVGIVIAAAFLLLLPITLLSAVPLSLDNLEILNQRQITNRLAGAVLLIHIDIDNELILLFLLVVALAFPLLSIAQVVSIIDLAHRYAIDLLVRVAQVADLFVFDLLVYYLLILSNLWIQ